LIIIGGEKSLEFKINREYFLQLEWG